MSADPGTVIRLRKWEHIGHEMRVSMGVPRGKVGVFVYLGTAKEKEFFDACAALESLGWKKKSQRGTKSP